MRPEVEFLGHKLSAEGLSASLGKISTLRTWHPPLRSSKEVRRFLGLILWYKTFIPSLATLAAPLFALTSTKARFEWNEPAQQSMIALKDAVETAPCLARWEEGRRTRIVTDTSNVGIGSVMEQ